MTPHTMYTAAANKIRWEDEDSGDAEHQAPHGGEIVRVMIGLDALAGPWLIPSACWLPLAPLRVRSAMH
jgi:hypothetical protein